MLGWPISAPIHLNTSADFLPRFGAVRMKPLTSPQSPKAAELSPIMGQADASRSLIWDILLGPRLLVLILLVVPCIYAVWALSVRLVQRESQVRFERLCEVEAATIERTLANLSSDLTAVAEFVSDEPGTARTTWKSLSMPLFKRSQGLQAVGYARWVREGQMAALLAEIRAEGFGTFAVKPAGERAEAAVVIHIEPFEGRNLRSFGYDLWSEPIRRTALGQARDTGVPTLTSRLLLSPESNSDTQPGAILIVPAYRAGRSLHSIEARRDALRGFVFAPIRIRDLQPSRLGEDDPLLMLKVHHGLDAGDANLMLSGNEGLPVHLASHASSFVHRRTLSLAGQVFTLQFSSLPRFEVACSSSFPFVTTGFAAALGAFALALCVGYGLARRRLEQRAASVTLALQNNEAELSRSHRDMAIAFDKLQELSIQQKAILDNAGYAIICTDPNGTVVVFNPAAERMLGYSANELIGLKTPAIFHDAAEVTQRAQHFSVELREPVSPGFDVFVIRSRRGLFNEYEWTYIRKDGSRFPVLLNVTVISDQDNRIRGYLGIAVDITARRRAEARLLSSMRETRDLKTALDANAIIEITDKRGVITYVNDNFCRISKYSRGELLGQEHRLINSGYHPKEFFRNLYHTLGRKETWHGEIRNKAKDGSIFWVDTTIVPMLDDGGQVFEFIIIRMDITQRKSAEQARQASEALLRQFITHTPASIAMLDERLCFLHVSARWLADFEMVATEVPGVSLMSKAHLPAGWLEAFPDVMAGRTRMRESDTYARADGSVHPLKWELRPWQKADGTVGGAMIFAQFDRGHEAIPSARVQLPAPGINPVAIPGENMDALPQQQHEPLAPDQGRVLLVEDEAGIGARVREGLTRRGYNVVLASDAPEALLVWKQQQAAFDIVVSDFIISSEMNGVDLIRELAQDRPELPSIIVSSYGVDGLDAGGGLFIPGENYLQKPYSLDELANLIRKRLDSRKLPPP